MTQGSIRVKAACAAIVALLVVGVAACGGGSDSSPATTSTGDAQAGGSGGASSGLPAMQADYERVVSTLSPSVVQVETTEGLGSGIVVDDKGDIVTNAHVVGDATSFTVTLASGKRAHATLVGTWEPGDLAVVHTDADGLHAATFADSSKLHVGDITVAVGNPLGLRSSVTQGIVSSLGRTVSEGNGVTLPAAIQTSAAINPGNSGGALADIQGRVIGIPTLAATDPQLGGGQAPGIGFAIPSNTVKSVARQLIDHGRVTRSGRASLGVEVATVTGGGVIVVGVVPGGPADRAGLGRGDVITSLDGTATPSVSRLQSVLAGIDPGQTVPIVVRSSDGAEKTHKITAGQLQG